MALTERIGPVTSSYNGSLQIISFVLFECSRAALTFALLLFKTTSITVIETNTLTVRTVARDPIDIMYAAVLVSKLCMSTVSVPAELRVP